MTSVVTYEVVRGVAWLTIDRPEARDALSREVRAGLFAGAHWFNDEAHRVWEPVHRSDDAQEGPAAFRDKPIPVWTAH